MRDKTAQWFAVIAGVALIILYSGIMMATEGNSAWSWILLLAGIALLIGGERIRWRDKTP